MNPLLKIILYPIVKTVVENTVEYVTDFVKDIEFFKDEEVPLKKSVNKNKRTKKFYDKTKWTIEKNILAYIAYDDFLKRDKVLGIKICTTKIQVCHILNEIMDADKSPETIRNKMKLIHKDDSIKNIPNKDIKLEHFFGHKIKEMIKRETI